MPLLPLLCFLFFYSFLYAFRLSFPPLMYFDEVYFVPAARAISTLSGYSETTHPPLGKILIALVLKIFGDQSWTWRLPSLLASAGSLILIEKICFLLSGRKRFVGYLTILLLTLDGLWITQSRIGLLNAPMLFLMLASIWCVVKEKVQIQKSIPFLKRKAWLLGGIFAGLAVGTKWSAVSILPLIAIWSYIHFQTKPISLQQVRGISFYWILVPLISYFATFLVILWIQGYDGSSIWNLQKAIPQHHLVDALGLSQRYSSPWWSWPFMTRPIWYGFNRHDPSLPLEQQIIDGILCIGNPAIFWMILPAIGFSIWQFIKHRNPLNGLIVVGFLTEWMQSVFITRYTLFHHFYPALPFAAMAIAFTLYHFWNRNVLGKLGVGFYFGIVVTLFIYWYPLWTGIPISYDFYQHHLWFTAWK